MGASMGIQVMMVKTRFCYIMVLCSIVSLFLKKSKFIFIQIMRNTFGSRIYPH